jgi:hyperosmotically inducible periplasmic protein
MAHRFERIADWSLAMETTRTTIPPAPIRAKAPETLEAMRSAEFRPRRSIWPRVMIAAVIAAGATALLVSHYYDDRSLGAKLDDTVATAGSTVQGGVDEMRTQAAAAAQGVANAADRAADAVGDASITAAVKTALAADPSLSAVKIDVTTRQGAVELIGPAPDEKSRQRAEVLAAAPQGVARVENKLVVPGNRARPSARAAPQPTLSPPVPVIAPMTPMAPITPVEEPKAAAPTEIAPAPLAAPAAPAQ